MNTSAKFTAILFKPQTEFRYMYFMCKVTLLFTTFLSHYALKRILFFTCSCSQLARRLTSTSWKILRWSALRQIDHSLPLIKTAEQANGVNNMLDEKMKFKCSKRLCIAIDTWKIITCNKLFLSYKMHFMWDKQEWNKQLKIQFGKLFYTFLNSKQKITQVYK